MKQKLNMRTIPVLIAALIAGLISTTPAWANERHWVGMETGTWSDTQNWSEKPGGPNGASMPGRQHIAVFDENGSGNCVIDEEVSVAGIRILPGYAGAISQNHHPIRIGTAGFHQAGGTFQGGSADMVVTAPSTAFAQRGGSFTAPGATLIIQSPGSANTGFFVHSGGDFHANRGTLHIRRQSSGNPRASRTQTLDIRAPLTLHHLVYEKSAGASTLTLRTKTPRKLVVGGNFTIRRSGGSGALILNDGIIQVLGHLRNEGGSAWGSTRVELAGAEDQTYAVTDGGGFPHLAIDKRQGRVHPAEGTRNMDVQGFHLVRGAFTAPAGVMTIRPPNASVTAFAMESNTRFHANQGTLHFLGQTGYHWNTQRNCAIRLHAPLTLHHLIYDQRTGRSTVRYVLKGPHSDVTVTGNFTITNSSSSADMDSVETVANGGRLNVHGDILIGEYAGGGSTALRISGKRDQKVELRGGKPPANHWTIDKSGGTLTLASDLILADRRQDLHWKRGVVDFGSHALKVGRNLRITAEESRLPGLDLDRLRNALFESANGVSVIQGELKGFQPEYTEGDGTREAPYATKQTVLRAAPDQILYYSAADGLNRDLGEKVYRLADLNGNAGQGGRLMPLGYAGLSAVATHSPLSIASDQAVLAGRLLGTGGTDTSVWVHWGRAERDVPDEADEWEHAHEFAGPSDTASDAYRHRAESLESGVRYVYRFRSVNPSGETWGAPLHFTTWEAPAAKLESVFHRSWGSASWRGNLQAGHPLPSMRICLNPETDAGTTSPEDWKHVETASPLPGVFTNHVFNLTAATLYHARLFVTNEAGSAWSDPVTFKTEPPPARLTVDGNRQIDGAAPSIRFAQEGALVQRSGDVSPWLYDFSIRGARPATLDLGDHTLYCARAHGEQEIIVMDLGGGSMIGTGRLALRTWQGEAGTSADNLVVRQASSLTLGGIDLRVTASGPEQETDARPGSLALGSEEEPVGPVRIGYVHAHADARDKAAIRSNGGTVTIHGTHDVLIVDREEQAGDILTRNASHHGGGHVFVAHRGHFRVGTIDTCGYGSGDEGRPGHVNLDGGDASGDAVIEGTINAALLSRSVGGRAPRSIVLRNYRNVTIGTVVGSARNENSPPAALFIDDGIAGDIRIGGTVDLSSHWTRMPEFIRMWTDRATLPGPMVLRCGGSITLEHLDLIRVDHAMLSSGSGTSRLTGDLLHFDTEHDGGQGTEEAPFAASQSRLRIPTGQTLYYSAKREKNQYLNGAIYRLAAPSGHASQGGLLRPHAP